MNDTQQKAAAKRFAQSWAGKGYEKGESQPFWLSLLRDVYGVEHPEEFIRFEEQVHIDKSTGFIDAMIPATRVMIEQKKLGKDLNKPIKQSDGSLLNPFTQAKRYIVELPVDQHPRWVVTCNFEEFYVYDMNRPGGEPEKIKLADLENECYRLQFLVETENEHIKREEKVSKDAGDIVGLLYDALLKQYMNPDDPETLKSLNILCVRLVFCLYAEDAGIFGRHGMFHDYLAQFDTRQMRKALAELFQVLDQKPEDRDRYLEADNPTLAAFPYVNGGLFENERVEIPPFTDEIRELLLTKASADFDWSEISPTIFGAVFESTLNPETRRSGGMHYTSIRNIHKVIDPLFLDELKNEFEECKAKPLAGGSRTKALQRFHDKLGSLTFLDPACGSGNFLTESYISIRRIENDLIRILRKDILEGQMTIGGLIDTTSLGVQVSISQFYGIEINDFAVDVARTALWIAESQMLHETERIVQIPLDFLPLKTNVYIKKGNALRMDWESVVPKSRLNYIMGNPPFVGARTMSTEQKGDMIQIVENESSDPKHHKNDSKNLDYVTAWYFKAARYIYNTNLKVGFVSTSSICQGEQVAPLWGTLISEYNIIINYAYSPFKWESESKNTAQVFVTIIGFSTHAGEESRKTLFMNGTVRNGKNISPYLTIGDAVIVKPLRDALKGTLKISFGNQPRDGGNLILSEEECKEAIKKEPFIKPYILPYIGSKELINGKKRYCLWLKDVEPVVIVKSKFIYDRVEKVREFRLKSKAKTTNQYAKIPMRFAQVAQPSSDYLAIPEVSTSKRRYIPMGFFHNNVIASNKLFIVPDATLYHFGVLNSNVHMAWMRVVAGRLGDGYNYSKELVYNPFPWPTPSSTQRAKIEQTAQEILDARALYPNSNLAALYNEVTMPPELRRAHQRNDKAVMTAYGFHKKGADGKAHWLSESECVAELMRMYQELTK